jgi:hypothetical protein
MATRNTLDIAKKIKVIDWIKGRRHDERTYNDLATAATAELGFGVTQSHIENIWVAVHGVRKATTDAAKIEALETRVAKLEAMISNPLLSINP